MITEIYGQGVTFNPENCEDYCMPLYGAGACGDGCGGLYLVNSLFDGNPLTSWTITAGAQLVEKVFLTDLSSEFTIEQSVSIPADEYLIFYSFDCSIDFDLNLTITNGPTAQTLFDTSLGNNSVGSDSITLTGADSRTLELAFTTTLPIRTIIPGYVYICPKEAYQPYTDFTFQLPLRSTGDNLLDDASINSGIVGLQAEITGSYTGTTSGNFLTALCGTIVTKIVDDDHASLADGEDGYYYLQYQVGSAEIAFGQVGGVSNLANLVYQVDNGTGEILAPVSSNVLSGSVISDSEILPSGTDYFDVYIRTSSEADSSGVCRYDFSITDLGSTIWKMWQTDTATLEDGTQYRLTFTNKNSTSTIVKVIDESSTTIFEAVSNGIKFDKVFQTGALPGTKTVTIRFEFADFIDDTSTNWEDTILTSAGLYKQCKYTVEIQDSTNTALFNLTEDQSASAETTGNSYNTNIEYLLDVNSLGVDTYSFVAYDGCDSADNGERSSYFNVCNGLNGFSQISWTPSNNKIVGDYKLDYTKYPTTKFLWVKCDIQDLDIQNEREFYVQSNGFVNVPWSRVRNLYTLVIYPVPRHVREALSFAFQDTFYIDGVGYQVVDEDAYSPLFTARTDNAMRITVHKVGAFSVSRNA